jgi:hypothetical protein
MPVTSESTVIRDLPTPSLPSRTPELAAIASYVRSGRCALFVGAGLSVAAGLPTWQGLMRRIVAAATPSAVDPAIFADERHSLTLVANAKRARRDPLVVQVAKQLGAAAFDALVKRRAQARGLEKPDADTYLDVLGEAHSDAHERAELERLLVAGRNQDVAARCREILGPEAFPAAVREALQPQGPLPATHRDIVRTPFACAVTTNFDDLLERAYLESGGDRPPAPTGAELDRHGDLLLRGAFFVLKAHGDLATPASLVFTADDYRRIVHANPAFQAVMSGILMTHAILFVGYSLNDVNFRLLLDSQLTTFRGRVPPRFAVMNGVGPAECETLWRTARLRVLPYPEGRHEEVGTFLRALADATAEKGRPRTRARRRRALPVFAPSADTLAIASDGERLHFELRSGRAQGGRPVLWVGSTTWQGFDGLRASVASTFEPAYTVREWNQRIERAGVVLSHLVPAGLRRALARSGATETLELAVSSGAEPIPWEWMRIGGSSLGMRTAVVRRPVDISPGARGRRHLEAPLRALVVGDAGSGDGRGAQPLDMAEQEADHVAQARSSRLGAAVTRLSRAQATGKRIVRELADGNYDLVHFAGHAWASPEDGYLLAWDRVVLGTEIAPLLSRRPPSLLVMSTHHTAFFPLDLDRSDSITPLQMAAPERLGEPAEDRGFTALAMRCGVTSFVGCCGSVSDAGSALVMAAFYDRLVRGDTTAQALRAARRRAFDQGDATGMMFVAIGEAGFRLGEPARTSNAAASPSSRCGPTLAPRRGSR